MYLSAAQKYGVQICHVLAHAGDSLSEVADTHNRIVIEREAGRCILPSSAWTPQTGSLPGNCGFLCLHAQCIRAASPVDRHVLVESRSAHLGAGFKSHKHVHTKVASDNDMSLSRQDATKALVHNIKAHYRHLVGLQETRNTEEGALVIDDVCCCFSAPGEK